MPTPDFAVILPAAGASLRFGGGRNKLLQLLGGVPVFFRSVEAFVYRMDVRGVYVAASDVTRDALTRQTAGLNVTYVAGGACRAESVRNAVRAVPDAVEWVAVHDAARPLVSQELINRTLAAAAEHGAAVPAVPVTVTVKEAAGPLPAPAGRTLDRPTLWAIQTPQVMRRADLLRALDQCPVPLGQVTDDAQLLELAGLPVWLVPGEDRNVKVTNPTDVALAEILLSHTGR